jgi:hypothetical protein
MRRPLFSFFLSFALYEIVSVSLEHKLFKDFHNQVSKPRKRVVRSTRRLAKTGRKINPSLLSSQLLIPVCSVPLPLPRLDNKSLGMLARDLKPPFAISAAAIPHIVKTKGQPQ